VSLESVLARLERAKPVSGGFMARCPAHPDDTASLSVSAGNDGRVLLFCHAGCQVEDILRAVDLEMAELFPVLDRAQRHLPSINYDYRDEAGTLLYRSVRFPPKDGKKEFRQCHPDGQGGWIWKMQGVRRVCYHLDQLQHKPSVAIVEGEKDADRLWSLGLPATTNSGGAGKWTEDHTQQLVAAGIKRVVILSDNDPPGEAHSLQVARSCDDAGLFVRRILLPDLPPKGDVSDWLNAGHTKQELLDIINAAPPFKATASVVQKPKLELTSLADLLAEPDDAIEWLVDERIPGGSLVLLAGKPKAGKSTLARYLAYCVAAGEPWMGHHVVMGPVWYLALEDKRSEVRRHFRMMGATGQEPLWLMVGEAPEDCIRLLEERAKKEQPVLIIVDTLQRLIQARDMNDYAEVTTKFSPLLKLCRDTGAACVVVHHANKFGEGLDCILGSTALSGSVDNIFIMGRGERDRTIQSIQRIGDDLESTVLELDDQTGHMKMVGSKRDADTDRAAMLILEAMREAGQPQGERWIRDQVEAAPKDQARALRMMLRRGWVYRTGQGKRGDPFMYGVDEQGAPKPEYVPTTQEVRDRNRGIPAQPRKPALYTKRETPTAPNPSLSTVRTSTRESHEPGKVVPLVSQVLAHNENGSNQAVPRRVSLSATGTYSGFATSDDVDDSLFANPEDEEGA
jgi:putative DNA primase/helicase